MSRLKSGFVTTVIYRVRIVLINRKKTTKLLLCCFDTTQGNTFSQIQYGGRESAGVIRPLTAKRSWRLCANLVLTKRAKK